MDVLHKQLMLLLLAFVLLGLCAALPKPLADHAHVHASTSAAAASTLYHTRTGAVAAPVYYELPLDAATASHRIDIVQSNDIALPLGYVHSPYVHAPYVQSSYVPYVWPYYVTPHYMPTVPIVQPFYY